jgi:hypothetical protein
MENCEQGWLPSVSHSEYTFYLEIAPTAGRSVNGCNKRYKFCPVFCSQVTLNLAGMYYQHKDDNQWHNGWQDVYNMTVGIMTLSWNNLQTSVLL